MKNVTVFKTGTIPHFLGELVFGSLKNLHVIHCASRNDTWKAGIVRVIGQYIKQFSASYLCTIGDKNITYLIFIPDELFEVIPCALCVGKRTFRRTTTELLDKNYLTEICFELIR